MITLFDFWRRRRWRRDEAALAQLGKTRPATVITGGSEGIGLELAREFAKRRDCVVLVARNQDKLAAVQQELAGASAEIRTIALDMTEPDACTHLLGWLKEQGLHVHELVNNAGIGLAGAYTTHTLEDIDRLVELNVIVPSRLIRAALPDMLLRGRGGILNIASLGGLTPGPYQAAYYASKAYVISLSRALACETRGMGLTITCIAPGPVETGFHRRMDAERAFYRLLLPALNPARVARSSLFWYACGRKLVIPGVFNTALAIFLSFLPGLITIPIVAFLLEPPKKSS
ncbi:MAG: SDR family NAD(P)-dependent oxidoreductase [Pseudomonadota bacterium]